jgi:PKD repeat protein
VITLTAKDPQNAVGTATRTITITAKPPQNQPPAAKFTFSCATGTSHQCTFDASTSTDDVGVVSYAWDWGNGRNETKTQPTSKNSWPTAGTFSVTLKVTDGGGLTSSITKSVVVP